MYKVVLATRNKNKIREFGELLRGLSDKIEILSLDDIGYEGDIEEDGATYEENSVIKSSVPASLGYIGVADDSGLSVDVLDGAPGIFSARYAGEHVTYTDNNEKLLAVMKGESRRGARFVCVMSLTIPDELGIAVPDDLVNAELSRFAALRCGRAVTVVTLRGECFGTILDECRGEGGFGYDPLFYYEPYGKTFAEMTQEEKGSVSHRGAAVRLLTEAADRIFK